MPLLDLARAAVFLDYDGTISTRDTGLYIVAQVIGGCLGATVANVMFELPAVELSTKVRSSPALWLSEVVATVGLLLVINGCVRTGRAAAVPFAVGAWIGGAVISAGLGYRAPALAGVGLSVVGLVVLVVALRADRRTGVTGP